MRTSRKLSVSLRMAATVIAALQLCGCHLFGSKSAAGTGDATQASVTISVTSVVNPDIDGAPQPVVLRLYYLRSEQPFAGADYSAIYSNESATLSASLIQREEYVLAPGQTQTLILPWPPGARYIGALAAFREPRKSQWRSLMQIPDHPPGKFTVKLDATAVTVSP